MTSLPLTHAQPPTLLERLARVIRRKPAAPAPRLPDLTPPAPPLPRLPAYPLPGQSAESLRYDLRACRDRIEAISDRFRVDDDGNFEISRREYEAYNAAVNRGKQIQSALAGTPEALP